MFAYRQGYFLITKVRIRLRKISKMKTEYYRQFCFIFVALDFVYLILLFPPSFVCVINVMLTINRIPW